MKQKIEHLIIRWNRYTYSCCCCFFFIVLLCTLDVLMSYHVNSSNGILIESLNNHTFIGRVNCTENHQPIGSLNCTVNESGAAIVEGSLQCVPIKTKSPSSIILPIVLAVIVLIVLITLILVGIFLCWVKTKWAHRNKLPNLGM